MDISILNPRAPFQIVHIFDPLKTQGDPFYAISNLNGNGVEFDPASLLKIGKLGDLHSIQPDLPPQAPCTEGRRLPIIFDEANIVLQWIDPEGLQTVQVDLLNSQGGRFDDDLILIVGLKPIG